MVLHSVEGMSQKDLDFLLDDKANTIGASSGIWPETTGSISSIHSKEIR